MLVTRPMLRAAIRVMVSIANPPQPLKVAATPEEALAFARGLRENQGKSGRETSAGPEQARGREATATGTSQTSQTQAAPSLASPATSTDVATTTDATTTNVTDASTARGGWWRWLRGRRGRASPP